MSIRLENKIREVEATLAELGEQADLSSFIERLETVERAIAVLMEQKDVPDTAIEKMPSGLPRPSCMRELNIGHDPQVVPDDGGAD